MVKWFTESGLKGESCIYMYNIHAYSMWNYVLTNKVKAQC